MVLCGSPQYFAKRGRPEHPTELSKHDSIIFYDATLSKQGREWTFTGPDGDFKVRLSGVLETNSPIAMRQAAIRGQGLVIAPLPLLQDDLKSGNLISIFNDFLSRQYSIDALYPHREHLPVKVRAFLDLVAKNFHQIDWDPCAHDRKRPANSGLQPAAAKDLSATSKVPAPG
jgi:DNA-binding transcriptional LysR family regulator